MVQIYILCSVHKCYYNVLIRHSSILNVTNSGKMRLCSVFMLSRMYQNVMYMYIYVSLDMFTVPFLL